MGRRFHVWILPYWGIVKKGLVETKAIFTSVCNELGAFLEEFDGEEDHVHLLVRYPPSVSISLLVERLKGLLVKF